MDFNNNNDTFFEQIVAIRKDAKTIATIIGIWSFALLILLALYIFAFRYVYPFLAFIVFGLGFGAWWLTCKLNVEYEYIITNGTIDIDKITNKSSRKRIATFELKDVNRLEKLNQNSLNNINKKELIIACNLNDDQVYLMSANMQKGKINLVFSPNKKIQSSVEKFAPKFITNNAFKN